MTGTSTSATIAGTARAASSVLTVTRTNSLPAACSARTCAAVAAASAVSVLVIDWTTIGWTLPTGTPPTLTVTVGRRVLTARNLALKNLVLEDDAQIEQREPQLPREARHPRILREPCVHTDPERVGVEDAVGKRNRVGREQRHRGGLRAGDGAGGRDVGRAGVDSSRVLHDKDLERCRSRARLIIRRSCQ